MIFDLQHEHILLYDSFVTTTLVLLRIARNCKIDQESPGEQTPVTMTRPQHHPFFGRLKKQLRHLFLREKLLHVGQAAAHLTVGLLQCDSCHVLANLTNWFDIFYAVVLRRRL